MSTGEAMSPKAQEAAKVQTVLDDSMTAMARTYASGFLDAAEAQGGPEAVEALLDEYDEFVEDAHQDRTRLGEILRSPFISVAKKDQILLDILGQAASPLLMTFLRVLNRRERLFLYDEVAREARWLWLHKTGQTDVTVTTAKALEPDQAEAVKAQVHRIVGGRPRFHFHVDESLLGGMIVRADDGVYDGSVRRKIKQYHDRLLEQRNHEIQNRRDQFSHPQ